MSIHHIRGWQQLRKAVNHMAVMDQPLKERLEFALLELDLLEKVNLPAESWTAVRAIVEDGKRSAGVGGEGAFAATVGAMNDADRQQLAERIFDCFLVLAKTMND